MATTVGRLRDQEGVHADDAYSIDPRKIEAQPGFNARTNHLYDVLRRIEFHGMATLAMPYFEVSDTFGVLPPGDLIWANAIIGTGNLIRLGFERQDTDTGEMGWGYSRWEFVSLHAPDDGIIKTAYLLAKLIIEHELMEAFLVDGYRVFGPHQSIEQLKAGQEPAVDNE